METLQTLMEIKQTMKTRQRLKATMMETIEIKIGTLTRSLISRYRIGIKRTIIRNGVMITITMTLTLEGNKLKLKHLPRAN